MRKIKVKKLITWSMAEEKDYEECSYSDEYRNAVIQYLRKKRLVYTGEDHQDFYNVNFKGVPVFNDKTCFLASMRYWGGIMSEATQKGDYMTYYC